MKLLVLETRYWSVIMDKVKRFDDVMTITLDARTWDLECTNIWEKILYAEYCSWSGHSIIKLSMNTIAKKLAATQTDFAQKTIFEHLKVARKSLINKGIIKEYEGTAWRNTKLIYLTDTSKTRKLKLFGVRYSKQRASLYAIKDEIEEVLDVK